MLRLPGDGQIPAPRDRRSKRPFREDIKVGIGRHRVDHVHFDAMNLA